MSVELGFMAESPTDTRIKGWSPEEEVMRFVPASFEDAEAKALIDSTAVDDTHFELQLYYSPDL